MINGTQMCQMKSQYFSMYPQINLKLIICEIRVNDRPKHTRTRARTRARTLTHVQDIVVFLMKQEMITINKCYFY